MKTLVIVSIPGAILSLELSDFPTGGPVEGRNYEFEGKLYKVLKITETLGTRGLLGSKIGADMRLLAFADAVSKGSEALKQKILQPKKIGQAGPVDQVSSGGIILPAEEPKTELGSSPDHIIFVEAELAEATAVVRVPRVRLSQALSGDSAESLLPAEAANQADLDQEAA